MSRKFVPPEVRSKISLNVVVGNDDEDTTLFVLLYSFIAMAYQEVKICTSLSQRKQHSSTLVKKLWWHEVFTFTSIILLST